MNRVREIQKSNNVREGLRFSREREERERGTEKTRATAETCVAWNEDNSETALVILLSVTPTLFYCETRGVVRLVRGETTFWLVIKRRFVSRVNEPFREWSQPWGLSFVMVSYFHCGLH